MDTLLLEAEVRDGTKKPRATRLHGKVPGVIYGKSVPAKSLQLDYQTFRKVYEKARENTIVQLTLDGKTYPVLIHDLQFDPVTDTFAHVDFMAIDMNKEVTTSVKVVILGIAPAVKNLGGILDVQKHEIKIKCLPKDLIHTIEVDVSSIVDFHTSIHVKDLTVPATVKILDNPADTVVTATPQKVEKEEPKPSAEAPVEGQPAAGDGTAAPGAPQSGAAQAPAKEGKK